MSEFALHVEHQVGRRQLMRQIEHGVAHQDVIVEIEDVKTDDEIGLPQSLDQIVDARFVKNLIAPAARAVGDADRHLHVAFAIPAAGVVRSSLRLEIEVDDIAGHDC